MGLFKRKAKGWDSVKDREYFDDPQTRDVHGTQNIERGERSEVEGKTKDRILALFISVIFAVIAYFLGIVVQRVVAFFKHVSEGGSVTDYSLSTIPVTNSMLLYGFTFLVFIVTFLIAHEKMMMSWRSRHSMIDSSDINTYENDQHVMFFEELQRKYDWFPNTGAHSSVQVSSMLSHMMLNNKGLKSIKVTERYKKDVKDENGYIIHHKGDIIYDEDGLPEQRRQSLIDEEFGKDLFTASGVPLSEKGIRQLIDTRKIEYNPKGPDGSRVDRDKLPYDTVSDLINDDWEFPDYEVQRPSGAYIVDTAPVNTMVLAITRAGKGQTVIEPTIDMWTREKRQNNIVVNDPKGELLVKFFVPATIRGYEIVQFNLINPLNTDIYNPLGFAAEAAREGNYTKAASYIENIGDVFFPVDGADDPMWPNAANNAFKRSAFGLIDFYLEEEKRVRKEAERLGKSEKALTQELDDMWGKVTLYNAYQLFVVLSAKKTSDPEIVQIDEDDPADEKDYLTLFFDATAKLPQNEMRKLVQNTDNALRAMAGSDKTIASVYGIALTAMSFFTDPTISTLTSGKPSQNFDAAGLSFPRRLGVRFGPEYLDRHRYVGLESVWSAYEDRQFTKELDPKKFGHTQIIDRDGWARSFFDGKFEKRKSYIKLQIRNPKSNLLVKTFYFELELTYKTDLSGRRYVRDPISGDKIIRDGVLRELLYNRRKEQYEYGETTIKKPYRDIMNSDKAETIIDVPAITQRMVKYTERPKMIYFITPPHLMHYAKLILILIKQMVDVNFESSYLTKENQKPLYKTRYMLDELGNLQSEGSGIPALQTMLSIGLGQEQQFTLILQTLQQLRDVYGDSVDKVIQGNALGLNAYIATPTGWVRNGDVQVGDEVLTPFGTVTTVTGVYPQGVRPVYEVKLRDGSKAESCNEHLWQIERGKTAIKFTGKRDENGKHEYIGIGPNGQTHEMVSEVIDTDELRLRVDKGRQINLPRIEPLAYYEQELPLHPYVLGVILGDGIMSKNGSVRVTNSDKHIAFKLEEYGSELSYYNDGSEFSVLGVSLIIRDLGLDGKRSYEKFIPEQYLYGSVEQRLDLLRGLMDTDGYISKSSEIEYSTASEQLAKDVQALIRSLGGRVNINVKENVTYTSPTQKEPKLARNAYRLQNVRLQKINPFSLPRKADRWVERDDNAGNGVVSVTYLRDEPVQCISVEDDRHLYITDDYMPTHNTENIVFLKSTDDEMIETLVKISGTTHESRVDQKTITKDNERLFNQNEGRISYTMATKERPVIQFNDFLFIKERNSIVLKAGSSPIWNRNETAYPMSWRLFSNTLRIPGKEFSLQTIPTNSSAKDFDVRKNQPDFFAMVNQRKAQAKHVKEQVKNYKEVYDITDADYIRLDQNVVADEIMDVVNRTIYNKEQEERMLYEQIASGELQEVEIDEFGMPLEQTDMMRELAEDNEELLREQAEAQAIQDNEEAKRYAGGLLSRANIKTGQFHADLANAYRESMNYFKNDNDFRVDEGTGELYSPTNTVYVESTKGRIQEDMDALSQSSNDPDSKTYTDVEGGDISSLEHYEVTSAFVDYLLSLDSWEDIAGGRFDIEVRKQYEMKEKD